MESQSKTLFKISAIVLLVGIGHVVKLSVSGYR